MVKRMLMLGLLTVFLSMTTSAFAQDVFVSPKGTKYHKETCRLIKNKENMTKMTKKEAVAEGYTPCRRCFKEDLAADDAGSQKKASTKKNQKGTAG